MRAALPELTNAEMPARARSPSLAARGLEWLQDRADELLSAQRLQRLSRSRFGRPFARRGARDAFDVVAGFTHTQVLTACVRLGLLDQVCTLGPRSAAQLAAHTKLSATQVTLLGDAAVALGLLRRRLDGSYTSTLQGRVLMADVGILAMIEHNQLLYRDLLDPVALIAGQGTERTALASYWPYHGEGERDALADAQAERYSELMSASQTFIAHEITDAVDFRGSRGLLDVGGGNGAFVRAVAAAVPAVPLALLDLPPVARAARAACAQSAHADRITCHGGDAFADALPLDGDVVTFVRVLHDHDDGDALRLLRAARAALPADGRLVIAEPMVGEPGAERIASVYFPLYFLAMGRGRARSRQELEAMARAAGFERFEHPSTHVPLHASVLVARP